MAVGANHYFYDYFSSRPCMLVNEDDPHWRAQTHLDSPKKWSLSALALCYSLPFIQGLPRGGRFWVGISEGVQRGTKHRIHAVGSPHPDLSILACHSTEKKNVAPLGPHPFTFSRELVCPSVLEAPVMFLGASGMRICFNW